MNTDRSIVIPLRGWIVLSLLVILSPSDVRAECNGQWDLSGPWNFNQGGMRVTFDLKQTGDTISGTGRYLHGNPAADAVIDGQVDGMTTGKTFAFAVTWSNGAVGEYSGAIYEDGGIGGTTFDQKNQGVNVDWKGDRRANCQSAEQCPSGQVWRDNFDGDFLCVRPDERHRLADGTCRSGYVWRDSFNGDNVCVTPAKRDALKAQKHSDELGVVTNRPGAADLVEPLRDRGVTKKPPAGFNPNK
jgi:hypothetical protein